MRAFFIMFFSGIIKLFKTNDFDNGAEDEICPVCGYMCLGNGGAYCIDKPSLVALEYKEFKKD